ncbi:EAL domain-containing protein [Halomonas vilamensis]|uniref:EAL domain-containing protein n=1 Tax=Vreelandella vilamensis TaxID=531309 RepID=A0ABU1H2J3_9GAMM|nr:EAL domain-containing protein [Halomonas vilamensis]MDR5898504.1 EAL domain-containing protein [Halomonas vilamensis]
MESVRYRYRQLFEQAPLGCLLLDGDGRIREANRAATDLLSPGTDLTGYYLPTFMAADPGESEADNDSIFWQVAPALQRPRVRTELMRAMQQQVSTSVEERLEWSGTWLEIRAYPSPEGLMLLMRDTTEHHRLLDQLLDQEAHLTASQEELNQTLVMRQSLVDSLPANIALLDTQGNILEVNEQWRAFGAENDNSDPCFGVGQNYLNICENATGDFAEKATAGLRAVLCGESDHFAVDYACHSPTQRQWFRLNIKRLNQSARQPSDAQAVVMHMDITERRRAEDQLRIAARLFDDADEAIVVTEPSGRIQSINRAFTRITGYTESDALGTALGDLLRSGRHSQLFYEEMWEGLNTRGLWQGEIMNRRKSGDIYTEWLTINRIDDDEGQAEYFVAVFSDITEIKNSHSKIEYLAHHDVLTGLPNRRLFQDRLMRAIARARHDKGEAALLFLDLDYFKTTNDTLGHEVGDKLLIRAAARLRELVRDADTVARIGGDEFTVILPNCGFEEAGAIAKRLVADFAGVFLIDDRCLQVTLSAGLALYPQDGDDVDTLSRAADMAMYRAKEDGRNRLRLYDLALHQRFLEETALEEALRRALDNNELRLVYQPQFDAKDPTRLAGAEALLRWQDPEKGPISPGQFIPLAEKSDLITKLGRQVVALVCEQVGTWRAAGLNPPPISFNVSPKDFRGGQLASDLLRTMAQHGVTASQLQVEFTEGTLTGGADVVLKQVQELHEAGIDLAIDDFGTGYSSLINLKRLPLAELKIDKAFVDGLGKSEHDEAIALASLSMARAFGLRTVAEGVETPSQLAWLQAHGSDRIQGFLLARPLEAEDFSALLLDFDSTT